MNRSLNLIPEAELMRLIVLATMYQTMRKDMAVKDALYDILSFLDELQKWLDKYPGDE